MPKVGLYAFIAIDYFIYAIAVYFSYGPVTNKYLNTEAVSEYKFISWAILATAEKRARNLCTVLNPYEEEKELQASECLRVGAAERGLLLALATRLAGNAQDGENLYQQTLLDCHDAIQRKGFNGSNYKFYILQSIKWLNVEHQRAAGRLAPLNERSEASRATAPAPTDDALATLAAEVEQEIESRYSPADAAAFRLHVAGSTYREIEQLTGTEFSWVRRRIVKMKESLRATFAQTYQNLDL